MTEINIHDADYRHRLLCYVTDTAIGWILRRTYDSIFSVIFTFGGIIFVTPYMAIPILPLVALYFAIQVGVYYSSRNSNPWGLQKFVLIKCY